MTESAGPSRRRPSFFAPGEESSLRRVGPDLVRVGDIDTGLRIGWLDISNCHAWRLDRPYAVARGMDGASTDRPQITRMTEEQQTYYDLRFPGWTEFRFLIGATDGRFFLLGCPSHQWYRDRLYHEDGTISLLNDPAFHGQIGLVEAADRILVEVGSDIATEVLIDSGHGRDVQEYLRPIPTPEPDVHAQPPLPATAAMQATTTATDSPTVDGPPATSVNRGPLDPAESIRHDRPRAGVQAALLAHMKDRNLAPYEEIATIVHGDKDTSENAISANVKRVNEYLESKGSTLRFGCGSGHVRKIESPE